MKKIFYLIILFLCMFNLKSYASTTDDLRELLSFPRMSDEELNEYIDEVSHQYSRIELNNLMKTLIETQKNSDLIASTEEEKLALYNNLQENQVKFNNALFKCQPASEVLKYKTALANNIHEINELKNYDYHIDLEYINNVYVEEYWYGRSIKDNQEVGDFELGDIGSNLKSCVQGMFKLTSPFGTRYVLDVYSKALEFHKGIDFYTPNNSNILAQFNGTILSINKENDYYTIEIQHGTSLVTKYKYLKNVSVKVNQEVNQYDKIGESGNKNYIQFELYLDTKLINPIKIYGDKGITAYNNWVLENPDKVIKVDDLSDVKNRVTVKKEYDYYTIIPKERGESISNVMLPNGYTRPEPGVLREEEYKYIEENVESDEEYQE